MLKLNGNGKSAYRTKFLAGLEKLQQKAMAGDQRARDMLARLLAGLQTQAHQANLDHEVEAAAFDDDNEEIVGAYGDNIFGPDDLDLAADIQRWEPTADQLTHKAMLRQQKWNDMNKVAPFARVQPPSVLKGTLGGQQEVISGQKMQVALWTGADDAETLPVSITFAPVAGQIFPGTGEGVGDFRPFGIIQFGTRGFMQRAEVDIGQGTQLTVGASAVSLEVAMEEGAAGTTSRMKLTGMLSFFPIVRTTPVTRTRYVSALGDGGTENVIVPPFAKEVTVWRHPNTALVRLTFLDQNNVFLYQFDVAAGTSQLIPALLSNDVVSINVTPVGMGGFDRARLIFGLQF